MYGFYMSLVESKTLYRVYSMQQSLATRCFGALKYTFKYDIMNEMRHKSVSTRLLASKEGIYGL